MTFDIKSIKSKKNIKLIKLLINKAIEDFDQLFIDDEIELSKLNDDWRNFKKSKKPDQNKLNKLDQTKSQIIDSLNKEELIEYLNIENHYYLKIHTYMMVFHGNLKECDRMVHSMRNNAQDLRK